MFFSLMKHSYQVLIALSRERCYPYRKLIPGSFGGEGGVEIKKKRKRERGEKNEHMGCKISELLKTSGGKTVAKTIPGYGGREQGVVSKASGEFSSLRLRACTESV